MFSEIFTEHWNAILTECSFLLMRYIIEFEKGSMANIQKEIQDAQKSVLKYNNVPRFQELQREMNNNVKKLEDHITSLMKNLFQRDN